MLIDWITLRFPLSDALGVTLNEKIRNSMGHIVKVSPDGEIVWDKLTPDWEAIRSDSLGLYWSITADGNSTRYVTIGASPSSLQNGGINVFGSLSISEAAKTIVNTASLALGAILPSWEQWDCKRLDITANYDLGNSAQVKQALRLLLGTDSPRRKTNSDKRGGDSVYWNPTSTLRASKAYHKGAHLRYQLKKGNIVIDEETLSLADRLLRLELMLGSMWFRRLRDAKKDWKELSELDLQKMHFNYFDSLIGSGKIEVTDMENILKQLEQHAPTMGQAKAAFGTYALIRQLGYEQAKSTVQPRSFFRHVALLKQAGLSQSQLCNTNVVQFKMKPIVLGSPVLSWDELRAA